MKRRFKLIGKSILYFLALVLGILLVAYLWPMPELPKPIKTNSITIKSINVVDVHSGHILENRFIQIEDDRIVSIDSVQNPKVNSEIVVDGTGKYLMPGLWDMHTHSTQLSPWLHHPLYIANGVTAVRDMSGQLGKKDSYWAGTKDRRSWNERMEANDGVSPRYVLQSSYQINGANAVPANFPDYFKMEKLEDVPQLLSYYQNEGADFIKVYSELPAHTYRNLARQVSKYDMHIAGHKVIGLSLEESIILGQRSFEHGRVFMFDSFPGAEELRNAENKPLAYRKSKNSIAYDLDSYKVEQLMKLMSEHRSYWIPTLQTLKSSAFADKDHFLENPHLEYIPRMRRSLWWNPDLNKAAKYNISSGGKGVNKRLYDIAKLHVGQAHELGVPIMAGTDVTDTYTFAGFSLHDELKELTESGLSNLEAIQSATIIPAAYSDLLQESGSVETGKLADLIILEKNPLEKIENTRTISGVVLNGTYYHSESLDQLKENTADLASSFHLNVKFVASLLLSPLMRKQLAD